MLKYLGYKFELFFNTNLFEQTVTCRLQCLNCRMLIFVAISYHFLQVEFFSSERYKSKSINNYEYVIGSLAGDTILDLDSL